MSDFDVKAQGWDADLVKVERARAVAEAIRERVPLHPPVSALEFGCGTGLLSFALQPYLSRITMADSSDGMLAVLRAKIAAGGITNMTPVRWDLDTDPLPSERFRLIYSLMTLHHIPDTERLLTDLHTLLEQGGYLCIADLDREDGSYHGPDFHGHTGFDRKELAEKARKAGFHSLGFSTVYRMNKVTAEGARSFSLFLMVAERDERG